jgi:hypothetical protein
MAVVWVSLSCRADDPRLPVPSDPEQQRALRLVDEVHADEWASADTDEKKRSLACKLLNEAADSPEPATRFVLLRAATRMATQGGDMFTAFRSIDEMDQLFVLDAPRAKANVLYSLSKKTRGLDEQKVLAEQALRLAYAAMARDDFDTANKLAEMGWSRARKARDKDLVKKTASCKSDVQEAARSFEQVKAAERTLEMNPIDPDANSAVGGYRCVVNGDWSTGLPMLALGRDPTLKALAIKELDESREAGNELKLADGWWEYAENDEGLSKQRFRERARHWYTRSFAHLTRSDMDRVEERLVSADRWLPGDNWVLAFDGKGSHIVVPSWKFKGSRAFTMEAIVSPGSLPENGRWADVASDTLDGGIALQMRNKSWEFMVSMGSKAVLRRATSDWPPILNKTVHLAATWNGQKVLLFVDGKPQRMAATTISVLRSSNAPLYIGAGPKGEGHGRFFHGVIRGIRISDKVRYGVAFQPPVRLTPDRHTVLLLPMDEGQGTIIHDVSGNDHHGTVIGARWTRIP